MRIVPGFAEAGASLHACIHVSGSVHCTPRYVYSRKYIYPCLYFVSFILDTGNCTLFTRDVSRISLYTAYTPMLISGNQRIRVSASEFTVVNPCKRVEVET